MTKMEKKFGGRNEGKVEPVEERRESSRRGLRHLYGRKKNNV